MPQLSLVLLAVVAMHLLLGGGAAERSGREGNVLYEEARYAAADSAYAAGLDQLDPAAGPSEVAWTLFYNRGMAHLQQEHYAEADSFFHTAALYAPTAADTNRAAYNAGHAAFLRDAPQQALAHFRQALLADPADDEARFNYEYVKRGLSPENQQQNEQQQQDEEQPEPSAYAQQIKQQAEVLVAQRRYDEASQLLEAASRQDPTMRAFRQFKQRVDDVAEIDEEGRTVSR